MGEGEWSDVQPSAFSMDAPLVATATGNPSADSLIFAAIAPNAVTADVENLYLMFAFLPRTNPEFEPVLKQATRYLLETQGRSGRLAYHSRDRTRVLDMIRAEAPNRAVYQEKTGKTPAKPVLEVSGGVPIEEPGAAAPTTRWRRRSEWAVGDDGDNSITQFAMLGLWGANRSRLKIALIPLLMLPSSVPSTITHPRPAPLVDATWGSVAIFLMWSRERSGPALMHALQMLAPSRWAGSVSG